MRPIMIDTNAYAAFMRGDELIAEVFAYAEKLYLSSIVLGELLSGFRLGRQERKNRDELSRFLQSPRVNVPAMGINTANYYALIYGNLRRKGKPISTNDLWISAIALEQGAALLTLDSHFAAVDGLQCGQQIEDFLP